MLKLTSVHDTSPKTRPEYLLSTMDPGPHTHPSRKIRPSYRTRFRAIVVLLPPVRQQTFFRTNPSVCSYRTDRMFYPVPKSDS